MSEVPVSATTLLQKKENANLLLSPNRGSFPSRRTIASPHHLRLVHHILTHALIPVVISFHATKRPDAPSHEHAFNPTFNETSDNGVPWSKVAEEDPGDRKSIQTNEARRASFKTIRGEIATYQQQKNVNPSEGMERPPRLTRNESSLRWRASRAATSIPERGGIDRGGRNGSLGPPRRRDPQACWACCMHHTYHTVFASSRCPYTSQVERFV